MLKCKSLYPTKSSFLNHTLNFLLERRFQNYFYSLVLLSQANKHPVRPNDFALMSIIYFRSVD